MGLSAPSRERLPETRQAITHKFQVGDHKGYITVGLYPDGRPAEIFITMGKTASTISGLMKCISLLTSVALQHGITAEYLASKFQDMKFEPSGYTPNKEIEYATSIIDYVFRWMNLRFNGKKP